MKINTLSLCHADLSIGDIIKLVSFGENCNSNFRDTIGEVVNIGIDQEVYILCTQGKRFKETIRFEIGPKYWGYENLCADWDA